VVFELSAKDFSLIDNDGQRVLEPGRFTIFVGGQQPDERSRELTGRVCLEKSIELTGERQRIPY
jgi:beta-glucosidase